MKPKKELTTEKAASESIEHNTEEDSEISDDGDKALEYSENSQEKEKSFKKKTQSRTVIRKQNVRFFLLFFWNRSSERKGELHSKKYGILFFLAFLYCLHNKITPMSTLFREVWEIFSTRATQVSHLQQNLLFSHDLVLKKITCQRHMAAKSLFVKRIWLLNGDTFQKSPCTFY